MDNKELIESLLPAMRAAKTGKTTEELEMFLGLALPALEKYENALADEDDYDEDDAFEAVFLALTEENEQMGAETALLLPVLMDALDEMGEAE